ncbi:hypothetical protein GCM10022255_029500 [Dactylosporangium darangshiense]|uniref:DUF2630 family protein n=2 Tax=Dactylosporangium darangshiense TaxID=579108 RepID=A0ABP8D6Q6_9ACTN
MGGPRLTNWLCIRSLTLRGDVSGRTAGGVARETARDRARGGPVAARWWMMQPMDDTTLMHQISNLVDEEHKLRTQLQTGKITEQEEHDRLKGIEAQLDQLWDLLRRRRAAKLQGVSPDEVEAHSIEEVEHYLQ